jgi:hypothetical protein
MAHHPVTVAEFEEDGGPMIRTAFMARMASVFSIAISLLLATRVAYSAEIKVLSAVGMKEVMEDLGPKFARASGHTLTIGFGNLGAVVRRIQDGELADVVILPGQGIDGLVKDGKARADDRAVLARSGIGVAVRRGAPTRGVQAGPARREIGHLSRPDRRRNKRHPCRKGARPPRNCRRNEGQDGFPRQRARGRNSGCQG